MTRRNRRPFARDLPPLDRLADELHARHAAASPFAAAAAAITEYVERHPGVTLRQAVHDRPALLSHATAEDVIRDLLERGRLQSDQPGRFRSDMRLNVASDVQNP